MGPETEAMDAVDVFAFGFVAISTSKRGRECHEVECVPCKRPRGAMSDIQGPDAMDTTDAFAFGSVANPFGWTSDPFAISTNKRLRDPCADVQQSIKRFRQ
jgi:hypothetical protein